MARGDRKALGVRSRSQDHHETERYLRKVTGGSPAARQLRDLINLKDAAHYDSNAGLGQET